MAKRAPEPEPMIPTPPSDETGKWDFVTEEFLRTRPEPPQEVVDEMNARHLELLHDLIQEFGPPSEEDILWARQVLKDTDPGS